MKKITTWSPDTCDCVINYEWDDTTPEDTRTHTVSSVVKKCSFHEGLNLSANYDAILEENTRKNLAIKKVKEIHPTADVKFSLDSNRDVTLSVKGVVVPDTNALEATLGAKVKVTL